MKGRSFAAAATYLMLPLSNVSPATGDTKEPPHAVGDTWSYIGCYSSFSIAWMTNVPTPSITDDLTPKKCQQACHGDGLSLAALTNGNNCHCHDNLDPLDEQLNNVRCNAVCSGDKNAKCGGSDKELLVWAEKGKELKKAKTKTKPAGGALSVCRRTRQDGKSESICNGGHKAPGANLPVPVVGLAGSVFLWQDLCQLYRFV
jgi:hypothetical protein